jgi:hypothetical protein
MFAFTLRHPDYHLPRQLVNSGQEGYPARFQHFEPTPLAIPVRCFN